MKCIFCYKKQKPLKIGGMVINTCCSKIQILRYTVRPNLREMIRNDPDVVLVDIEKE